jgi:ribosomal protein S18 acetylase RimI-like enzyme
MLLDNPIWHSLRTRHAGLAISHGAAARYPAEVAPFAGLESEGAGADLLELVSPGERVGILSVIPALAHHWQLVKEIEIHQYVWQSDAQAELARDAVKLTEAHLPAMLELTALVYPAYFRPGTARLGDYFGIFERSRLAAMAGIRMAMDGYQELSAICTHPDFRGRGYATRLTHHLVRHILNEGETPFLHTESDNPAKGMYEKAGFTLRTILPFRIAERT